MGSDMRVSVNRRAAQEDARLVIFELGNCFLLQHRMLGEILGLKPVQALIVLTVAISTVQKYMRQPVPDPAYRASVPLPDTLSGGISRRAIARSTGLPTETVRRCVEELVAIGRLEILSAQMVRTPPGSILWLAGEQLETMVAAVGRQADALTRAGVLEITPARRNSTTAAGQRT
jgi:hypothetical protein